MANFFIHHAGLKGLRRAMDELEKDYALYEQMAQRGELQAVVA